MPSRWYKPLHVLELARIEGVFAAVGNNWLIIFLSRHLEPPIRRSPMLEDMSLALSLTLGAAVAAGLAVYGMALNDVVDARRDRTFAPLRPIPSGRVGLPTAVIVAMLGLLTALTASVGFGDAAILLALVAAAGVLFFNAAGKFMPAIGIITLGLIHVVNMVIPNPALGFAWPLWLTMSHVMACAASAHFLEGKRPRLRNADVWLIVAGWGFWTLALLALMSKRNAMVVSDAPWLWAGPLVAAAAMVHVTWAALHGKLRPPRLRRAAGTSFSRWSMQWLILYGVGWLLGARQWGPAALLFALWAASFAARYAITLLDELAAPPPTYRYRG
jgi:4-hydroxybenzoate polyprenyltransferase